MPASAEPTRLRRHKQVVKRVDGGGLHRAERRVHLAKAHQLAPGDLRHQHHRLAALEALGHEALRQGKVRRLFVELAVEIEQPGKPRQVRRLHVSGGESCGVCGHGWGF